MRRLKLDFKHEAYREWFNVYHSKPIIDSVGWDDYVRSKISEIAYSRGVSWE